jgi:hypothetical protein
MAGYPLIDIHCHIYPETFFQEMTKVSPQTENPGERRRRRSTVPAMAAPAALFRQSGEAQSRRIVVPDCFLDEHQPRVQLGQRQPRLNAEDFPHGRCRSIQASLFGEACSKSTVEKNQGGDKG